MVVHTPPTGLFKLQEDNFGSQSIRCLGETQQEKQKPCACKQSQGSWKSQKLRWEVLRDSNQFRGLQLPGAMALQEAPQALPGKHSLERGLPPLHSEQSASVSSTGFPFENLLLKANL